MDAVIELLEKGLLTLAVSASRHGLERFGVPRGGPMDICRSTLANRLVGNPDGSGVLEMTMLPPRVRFLDHRLFAVVGGIEDIRLLRGGQERRLAPGDAAEAQPGDELAMGPVRTGLRAYLAVSGGILPPELRPRPLPAGARLSLGTAAEPVCRGLLRMPPSLPESAVLLRVTEGVQRDFFSQESLTAFYGGAYRCTAQCDRMGLRLSGCAVPFAPGRDGNIISEGMMPGDIQITSAGQPILMMADCQTVGGYAKIAHVIQADLPAAAQLRPGSVVRFRRVSVQEAQFVWRRLWAEMDAAVSPRGDRTPAGGNR